MSFYDETLYGLDDEMDEYGDTGAYGESPEEILEEEEEEEEEESGMPVVGESVVEVEEVIPVPTKPASLGISAGASATSRTRSQTMALGSSSPRVVPVVSTYV